MSDAAALFLGVDGGASRTRAVLVDAVGAVRGRGEAGGANQSSVGAAEAVASVQAATEAALHAAEASAGAPPHAAWIGLAGVDRPADRERLLPLLAPLAGIVRLTNDAALGLTALPDRVGVMLVAGTGSIAVGRNAAGETARAGGWGWLIGDEGSGFALGQAALAAASRVADGRAAPTALLPALLAHLGLVQPGDLIGWTYTDRDNARIAALSSVVFAVAREGDPTARRIVARAAGELARAAVAVGNALSFGGNPLPLALGGGLLLHEAAYREATLRRIARVRPVGPVVPVEEAALSAARAAVALVEISS